MAKKANKRDTKKDLKIIGFSVARIWTRFYKCEGFADDSGLFISCFRCDENGSIFDKSQEIRMNWPLRIWEPIVNFEVLKK